MVFPAGAIPRVVLDTNVLVSGLLTPMGSSARLIDLAQRGEIHLLYDDRMFREYSQVLRRPRFGFSPSAVDQLLEFLKGEGEHVVARPLPPIGRDRSDQPFLEVAVSANADWLITGNRRHYPQRTPRGLAIVTPTAAIQRLLL